MTRFFTGAAFATILLAAGTLPAIAQTTTQPWCHTFNQNLRVGDTGLEVNALRQALSLDSQNNVGDGAAFTDAVASAVTGFQQKYASDILAPNGLSYGTGYVGPSTRAKLNQLYGCNTPQPISTVPGCFPGALFSPTTGQSCSTPIVLACRPGDLFSSVTGERCDKQPQVACTYASPPTGCTYIKGPNYNPVGNCGLVLSCRTATTPVISGVSGPTSLQVGQQGTWTVKASDPKGGTLYYNVAWGDEVMSQTTPGTNMPMMGSQQTTFTHSYSRAGRYTPTFAVSNSSGISRTSIGVVVGQQIDSGGL